MDSSTVLVREQSPELVIASPAEGAVTALTAAMRYAAAKTGRNTAVVAAAVRGANRDVAAYFHYALAQQAADYLSSMDTEVIGVYTYNDEATPEDEVFGTPSGLPVLLLVKVERKTKALAALVTALDRALCEAYASLIGEPAPLHMLDVQPVTSSEIKNRQGMGAMFASLHHRPLTIWER